MNPLGSNNPLSGAASAPSTSPNPSPDSGDGKCRKAEGAKLWPNYVKSTSRGAAIAAVEAAGLLCLGGRHGATWGALLLRLCCTLGGRARCATAKVHTKNYASDFHRSRRRRRRTIADSLRLGTDPPRTNAAVATPSNPGTAMVPPGASTPCRPDTRR